MKKIAMMVSYLFLSANAFADIELGAKPDVPLISKHYVGEIVAATYGEFEDGVLISTKADPKNTNGQFPGLTLRITKKHLPLGNTLASSVGKKIAIIFKNNDYEIQTVSVVTDEFWYGNGNNLK